MARIPDHRWVPREPLLGLLVAAIAGLFVYTTLIDRGHDRRKVAGFSEGSMKRPG